MNISSNNFNLIKKEHNRSIKNENKKIKLGIVSLTLIAGLGLTSCTSAKVNATTVVPTPTVEPTPEPTPTPTPVPTPTATPEPPVVFTECHYDVSEEMLPEAVTIAQHGDNHMIQFTTEEGAAFILTHKESGYNVYLANCEENTETSIFDYMTGQDVDLQDCDSVEIHYIDELYFAGVMKELKYHGDHLGFELIKNQTESGKRFYAFSFDWRFPYNWANYYLESKEIDATVEMPDPDIPTIWENTPREDIVKVLQRTW